MISKFFIDRPVFAAVISIVIILAGLAAMKSLPIAQYPELVPPTVNVTVFYPGASAETLQNSVTQIIEQSLTGIDGLLYFTSTSSSRGAVNIPWIATQAWLGRRPRVPYTLGDMGRDALGVLDALGIERAHVVGLSMGAMIAQRVALLAPDRVLSLTSIMGSSGARGLLKPKRAVLRVAAGKPRTGSDAALAQYYLRFLKAIASPAFPPSDEQLHAMFRLTNQRSAPQTEATYRQLAAILADGERAGLLARITVPTLVVHGADDPWVPPACGRDTAARIAGARLALIPDMGHDLVPVGHPEIVRRVLGVLLPFLPSAATPSA